MTTYSIPSGLRIVSSRFGLQSNTMTHTSPLNQTVQTLELPGARWSASYTLTLSKRSEVAELQAFLIKLRGGAGRFYAYDPDAKTPRGIATGTPLVNGASQTGTSITTDGWTNSVTGILKAGDYFTVNNELKMITQDINSNGSGQATLVFEPALRSSPADNAAITVNTATCIMRLTDDAQAYWETDHRGLYQISFSGIEVF